jgi:signal transduction histidine kinase
VSKADLQQLAEVAEEKSFAAGAVIFTEGTPGDGIYLVKSGSVQISGIINSGQREVFAHVGVGEIFGEMAVLDDLPRSASAIAEMETVVYFIPRDQLLRILRTSAELSLSLVQEISKRLREFNRHYVQKALQSERMSLVGRFAHSIVHDLKTPLTVIGMSAEAACHDKTSPRDRRAAAARIKQQLERVTGLVNDILEYTRGGQSEQTFEEVDYSNFILGLVNELQSELQFRSVRIEYGNPPPAIKMLIAPKRLARVLYNLIGNAVDAMPTGGTIQLRFSVSAEEVVTEVRDSGPGIAPEVIDRIFEAFVTFGKKTGTGLGLSICRRIVEEHGGRLTACNHPSGGAAFTMSLPRKR